MMAARSISMRRDGSFAHLLYLYLWPFWLFRDASRGTALERAAAYRANRQQRVHLPSYAMKWAVLTAVQGALIALVERGADMLGAMLWLAAGLGTTASASAVVIVVCLASWAYLSLVDG
jgi:hypothetical protein